jgi:hypothetical protein
MPKYPKNVEELVERVWSKPHAGGLSDGEFNFACDCVMAFAAQMRGAIDRVPDKVIEQASDRFQADILHMSDYHCVGELYRAIFDAAT